MKELEEKEASSCTSSMSVCGHWVAREEQGADGAEMEKIRKTVCDGIFNTQHEGSLQLSQATQRLQHLLGNASSGSCADHLQVAASWVGGGGGHRRHHDDGDGPCHGAGDDHAGGRVSVSNKGRGRTFFVTF